MARLAIMASDLSRLKEAATTLNVYHTDLLSLLVEEMYLTITNDTISRVRACMGASTDTLRSISVSRMAAMRLRDLQEIFKVHDYALVSYLLDDNLVAIVQLPETFYGLELLAKRTNTLTVRKLQVGVSRDTYAKIKARANIVARDSGHPLSGVERVNIVLSALDREHTAEYVTTDEFRARVAKMPRQLWTTVRLTSGNFQLISDLATRCVCSRSAMITLLLEDDLAANDLQIISDVSALGTDFKRIMGQNVTDYARHTRAINKRRVR